MFLSGQSVFLCNFALLLALVSGEKFGKIANEFVVVFHPGVQEVAVEEHMTALKSHAHSIIHNYHIGSDPTKEFRGYAISVPDEGSSALKFVNSEVNSATVKYVEQNTVVRAADCMVQQQSTWGITRTSEFASAALHNYKYSDGADGQGTTAYIMDTGIATTNVEFEGRAIWGADFTPGPSPGTDLNGHGTHVAGTVIGKLYGVAKRGTAVAVAVLDPDGGGSLFAVLAGINWSVDEMNKKGEKGKSVGNMSLQSNKLLSKNDAVNAAVDAGLPMIVAAGNDSGNACGYSPASAERAYTVMASDESDTLSHFSNWGECADIIAPGSLITAAWISNDPLNSTATRTISGTSMAAPHVAGVALKILSRSDGMNPSELYKELTETANEGKIVGIPDTHGKTPNLLVYKPCKGPVAPTPPAPAPTPIVPTPVPPAPQPTPVTPTPAPPACSAIPPMDRAECGGQYFGNKFQCEAAFGGRCCWEQGGETNVWCYEDALFATAPSNATKGL